MSPDAWLGLPVGTILKAQYTIEQVLSFQDGVGAYQAVDGATRVFIKELCLPSDWAATLEEVHGDYPGTLKTVMEYRHPNLARVLDGFNHNRREYVVMEWVQGRTLEEILAARKPDRGEVAAWVQDMCDALQRLQTPPAPYLFGRLTADHVMKTNQGDIKLVNFGLKRFLQPAPHPPVMTDDPVRLREDYVSLGRLLYRLVTGEALSGADTSDLDPVLDEVVGRLLTRRKDKIFKSFVDVKMRLSVVAVRNPGAEPEPVTEPVEPEPVPVAPVEVPTIPVEVHVTRAWRRFLRASPVTVAVATAVVISSFLGVYHHLHTRVPIKRDGATLVVTYRDRLAILDPSTGATLAYRDLPAGARSATPVDNGRVLLVDDRDGQHLLAYDTRRNRILKTLDLPVAGCDLFGDGRSAGIVSESAQRVFPFSQQGLVLEGLVAVPQRPTAVLEDGSGTVYAALGDVDRIAVVAPRGHPSGTIGLAGGPAGMALADENRQLWVACKRADEVKIVNLRDRRLMQSLRERLVAEVKSLQGHGPTAVLMPAGSESAYVVCPGSDSLSVVDVKLHSLVKVIQLPGEPVAWSLSPRTNQLLVGTKAPSSLVVLDLLVSGKIAQTLPLEAEPVGVAYAP